MTRVFSYNGGTAFSNPPSGLDLATQVELDAIAGGRLKGLIEDTDAVELTDERLRVVVDADSGDIDDLIVEDT